MENQKKLWVKPVLIVIGRGTPEESILDGCKQLLQEGPAANGCKQADGSGACKAHGNT